MVMVPVVLVPLMSLLAATTAAALPFGAVSWLRQRCGPSRGGLLCTGGRGHLRLQPGSLCECCPCQRLLLLKRKHGVLFAHSDRSRARGAGVRRGRAIQRLGAVLLIGLVLQGLHGVEVSASSGKPSRATKGRFGARQESLRLLSLRQLAVVPFVHPIHLERLACWLHAGLSLRGVIIADGC